jgi:uncharacterized protein with PQ loop repeat
MWQDTAIAGASIAICIMMLPQVYSSLKGTYTVHPITASGYAISLAVLSITFFTLNLPLATTANMLCTANWMAIALCSLKHRKKIK